MSPTRASVLAITLLTLVLANGCCVAESRLVWTTHFDGTTFNLDGRRDSALPLDDGATIIRNGPGDDAIRIRLAGWSQIIVICHLPADPDHHGYSMAGPVGNGPIEAWLIPEDIYYVHDFASMLLTMTDKQRRQMPDAYEMRGMVSLQALWLPDGENVKSLRLNLRTIGPVSRYAFRRDNFDLENLRSRADQPATCRGEISGRWVHPCHIVPFI